MKKTTVRLKGLLYWVNSLTPGRSGWIIKVAIFQTHIRDSRKLELFLWNCPSGECHKTSLMIVNISFIHLSMHPSIPSINHIHFRLRCCPCPILWGWQHQARCQTPAVHASLSAGSTTARPHSLTSVFTHSDHVLWGLPFFLVPGIWKFVIDLIQDVAHCTWPYNLSRQQWRPSGNKYHLRQCWPRFQSPYIWCH